MAAAQLYRGYNVGVDMDADSVVIAKNNATSNGLLKNIRYAKNRGYNSRLVHAGAPYDLIMANIFAGPLSHMAHDLKRHLKPGGMIVLAGLLNHQANKVIAAHRMQKLYLIKRLRIGEWSLLALKRRKSA
jgi:ribosomal protein L11 methyltransferase